MKKKILLEKTASEIAKEHGLIYGGFGGWVDPKTREVKARTVDGKFVPVDEDPGSNAKEDLGKVIIFDFDPVILNPDAERQDAANKHSAVLKAAVKAGVPVFVLSPQGTEKDTATFLSGIGVKKGVKLIPIDSSNPQRKVQVVEEKINDGFKHIVFFDDDEKTNHAIESLAAKYNRLDVQIDAHLLPAVSTTKAKEISPEQTPPVEKEAFGIRVPSLKKRFVAATSVKRMFKAAGAKAPRGGGLVTNPKRALYNKAYRAKTIGGK